MNRRAIAISLLLLAGCAHTGESPLIFGQTNTLGLSIGASAADQGGDLVLGYKGYNFALVPVTVMQPGGSADPINAIVAGDTDAYSVLGQFEASGKTGTTTQKAGLGTFFATGLAAKRLADGFAQRMGDNKVDKNCNPIVSPKPAAPSEAAAIQLSLDQLAVKQAEDTQRLTQQLRGLEAKSAVAGTQPERKPNNVLMYAQYNSLGFIATAASTQQGADLTLGYKDRNLAIVPSLMRDANGVAVPRYSTGTKGTHDDALSVLGQFDFKGGNEGGTVDFGLGKFFSTGIAARRLGDGFHAKLCGEYEEPKKPAPQQEKAKN